MQKVFINKETNMVEQILKEEEGQEIKEDYFDNCYMIEDKEEKINSYNLKYNKEVNEFEIIEGIPDFDEVIIEKGLNAEELKKENEKLENKINVMQAALDEIILNLI